jgi:hypothetical protein
LHISLSMFSVILGNMIVLFGFLQMLDRNYQTASLDRIRSSAYTNPRQAM